MNKQGLKRTLSFILCLVFVLMALASCKRTPEDENGESSLDEAASETFYGDYTIIIPSTANDDLRNESELLADLIETYTGASVTVFEDGYHKAEDSKKEILIGSTNRDDSNGVELPENGYVIDMLDNGNIVIGGTSQTIVCDAVTYYINNILYASEKSGENIMTADYYYKSEYQTVKVDSKYVIVYSDKLDDNNSKLSADVDNPSVADYEVEFANQLAEKLAVKGINVKVVSDKTAAVANEILVGETNRAESKSFLSLTGAAQYGIGYDNGKITVGGHSVATTMLACARLEKILTSSSDASALLGKASVRSNFNWALDFPCYDGGTIAGVSESYYDGAIYYITGTNADEYNAYCEKLVGAGYENTMTNAIDGNLFASYSSKKVTIYVYFVPSESAVRLIVADADNVEFPQSSTESYEKVTDVSITQTQLDFSTNSGGMGYIVTLEDGSFLMIDSGSSTNSTAAAAGNENKDHVRIWNLLNMLNKRKDGKIIIRGWFITHEHQDHIMVFRKFCEAYGKKVTIEKYYECVVPKSVCYNSRNPDYHVINGKVDEARRNVTGGFDMVMLHTGMKFTQYGADIEILFTVEDLYPKRLYYFNNSSTTFKITSGGYSALITGDIYTDACNVLVKRYSTALKSDILQAAHHGNQGATKAFYDAVKPTVVLWPTSKNLLDRLLSGNSRPHEIIDKYVYYDMGVKEHYTNGEYSVQLKLPYVLGSAQKYTVPTTDQYTK